MSELSRSNSLEIERFHHFRFKEKRGWCNNTLGCVVRNGSQAVAVSNALCCWVTGSLSDSAVMCSKPHFNSFVLIICLVTIKLKLIESNAINSKNSA